MTFVQLKPRHDLGNNYVQYRLQKTVRAKDASGLRW